MEIRIFSLIEAHFEPHTLRYGAKIDEEYRKKTI